MLHFFINNTSTSEIYTLSLHDALPISRAPRFPIRGSSDSLPAGSGPDRRRPCRRGDSARSEEHTSELQSLRHLVCRLLLEKQKSRSTSMECRIVRIPHVAAGWGGISVP